MDSTRVPIDQIDISDHSGAHGDHLYTAPKPEFQYLAGSHTGPAQQRQERIFAKIQYFQNARLPGIADSARLNVRNGRFMDSTRVPIDQIDVSDHSGAHGDQLYIALKPDFCLLAGSHTEPVQERQKRISLKIRYFENVNVPGIAAATRLNARNERFMDSTRVPIDQTDVSGHFGTTGRPLDWTRNQNFHYPPAAAVLQQ